MKKVIGLSVATLLLGNTFIVADQLDDEIKRLEKENKILELQNQRKELELQNQQTEAKGKMTNKNLTSVNNVPNKSNKDSKNGFFLGVEGNLGKFIFTPYDTESTFFQPSLSTTFDIGLVGGYQHYFGESQRHGLKVSAHLYSGYISSNLDTKINQRDSDGNLTSNLIALRSSYSYIPIKVGLDVKYLWDFFEKGKHTLGLNVGLGYEFSVYTGGKIMTKSIDGYLKTNKINNIFSNMIYPVIGLHYYYGHHQFEVMYRYNSVNKGFVLLKNIDYNYCQKATIGSFSYLTLNYAYRF
ncbi:hypothetical protein [Helicobacter sp. 11S03491-1]|uniref:hypothetical protein n=1 Tax=Helicobacter sp. 11S03491-1 TaxID=1476196 RepID=UPI000BA58EC8|nr:hypothetical protein [Helicobacter sp. 11S03491-1]PAF42162.1 hypothetical protein BKH45_04235 [Helicobacter sp. 11S03491-1]